MKKLNEKFKENDGLLRGFEALILFLTLLAAVCIGIKQNQINSEQKEISGQLLEFEQIIREPLLLVYLDQTSVHSNGTFSARILFSNKGSVPIDGVHYGVMYLDDAEDELTNHELGGVLAVGETVSKQISIKNFITGGNGIFKIRSTFKRYLSGSKKCIESIYVVTENVVSPTELPREC